MGTRLLMPTAYHPQADGLAERKNQAVEIATRYHYFMNPESTRLEVVPWLRWNLNSSYSGSIQSTHHEQLFGFKLTGPLDVVIPAQKAKFKEVLALKEHLREHTQRAMDFATVQSKRHHDKKHRALEFAVGGKVYLRLDHGYHLLGKPPRKYSQ